jgi:ABC-2 type transport system permease protein
VSGRLFRQNLYWFRTRLLILIVASVAWGMIGPVIYVNFSSPLQELVDSGAIPSNLLSFGSGSLFSLPGALTLMLQHPIAIAFMAVFGAAAAATSIAGELERGTLETLLARPLPRRSLYASTYLAIVLALALIMAALLIGQTASVMALDLADEVDLVQMPLVWVNGILLWSAFAAFGVAASVTFDRASRAVGLTAAFVLISYFFEIIGSLWTDAAFLQDYSLFHYFVPGKVLTDGLDPVNIGILLVALVVPVVWALAVFPRRQLPAPA